MKIIILFIGLIFSTLSFSQTENENYKEVSELFMSYYNQGNYEAIFNLFDTNMQAAIPLENTVQFLDKNLKTTSGNIQIMEFYKLKQTAHIYKTTFENSIFDVLISLDDSNKINGLFVSPYKPDNLPKLERNITKMILPFNEEWFVFWGGTEVSKNYHVAYENQQYAYDLLIVKDGSSYKGDPKMNENYFVFGKDIIAPCDAKVVSVVTGVHDNIPGEMNPDQLTGNTIVLETEQKEYLLFAHLKQNSIIVEEGQLVKQGDVLGQCGNSGNTTEAHLHLSLQNVMDMQIATGAKLFFDKLKVNGVIKEDYLPVKNDKIQNIKL